MLHEMCGKQAKRSLTKVRFFSQSGLKRTASPCMVHACICKRCRGSLPSLRNASTR